MEKILEFGSPEEIAAENAQRVAAAHALRAILPYVFLEPLSLRAIELFAGDGGWVTSTLLGGFNEVVLVENSSELCRKLELSWQKAVIINRDSIKEFRALENQCARAEVVSLDNPSAIFGPHSQYCEHFDLLPLVLKVKSPTRKVLIFNVNTLPFSVESFPGWAERREGFYGSHSGWSLADYVSFYRELCSSHGWYCKGVIPIPRRGTFLWMFAVILSTD